ERYQLHNGNHNDPDTALHPYVCRPPRSVL
ncbi:MAG: hypothetical protein AVDCRST_MAG14-2222, partial [uncultured Rubrobacteraceae bacterium]